jgi:hypothetical protein
MPKLECFRTLATGGVALAVCALATSATAGLENHSLAPCQEVEALKIAYLRCEQAAQTGQLQTAAIAECSEVYHDLREQAFDGDFGRLRAWYQHIVTVQGLRKASASVSGDPTGRSACR